ncbi:MULTISPECIES: hypothetical protein [unclassified Pseudomonas]|uniref:hypothetical protein n=1 Tax=unclassified Pseudomonas TaxID=196821 RepID=UPI000BA340F4|nr:MULTISPECIES: hypothetical protein [unclassified Pseudomonas]UVL34425.1 hypothetical protein LOY43_26420 [Pseudomonas sp. B21-041]
MSHSNMKGTYNSFPKGHQLVITTMDESAGRFTGTFLTAAGKENISGGFHFNNAAKKTDLSFSTSDANWAFEAKYNNDGPDFEEWNGLKKEKSNPEATALWPFYKDLSGGTAGLIVDGNLM